MTDFQAVVLGFVQGATEWLPISSTAHLRIVPALLGWGDPGAMFTAVIQWGTFFAALVYFRKDILQILFRGRLTGRDDDRPEAGRHLLLPVVVGTIPVVIAGVLLKKHIEGPWRSFYVIGASFIAFGLLLGLAEKRHVAKRQLGSVTLADGLAVGIGQAFALIPGASRSGTTITAALFQGLERATAARFSFLLSLPAVFAAGAKELYDAIKEDKKAEAAHLAAGQAVAASQHLVQARPLIIATIVAFVVGLASIDWLMRFLKEHPTYVFIVYRLVVGTAILALAAAGLMK